MSRLSPERAVFDEVEDGEIHDTHTHRLEYVRPAGYTRERQRERERAPPAPRPRAPAQEFDRKRPRYEDPAPRYSPPPPPRPAAAPTNVKPKLEYVYNNIHSVHRLVAHEPFATSLEGALRVLYDLLQTM